MKKRKAFQPVLFPENWLQEPVRDPHRFTSVIGHLFEGMTAELFQGTLLETCSVNVLCPDVYVNKYLLVESKASCRNCFVLQTKQCENYVVKAEEELVDTYYALWGYGRVIMDSLPIETVLEKMALSIQFLLVLPLEVLVILQSLCPKLYYINNSSHFSERVGYRRLTKRVFGPLLTPEAEEFLVQTGVERGAYQVHRTTVSSCSSSVFGRKFVSNSFDKILVKPTVPF